MKAYIYCIKNIITNKIYIGSTKNFKSRLWYHFYHLKNNKHHSIHLQRSYDKYGKENFNATIIEECDILFRQERELYHIKINNSFNRDFGYNVNEPNNENFKHSNETKVKLRNSKYSKDISIAIDMYNLNGILIKKYSSINNCAKDNKINSTLIHEIINGRRKSYKGYTYVLKDHEFNYKPSNKQRSMLQYYK